MSGSCFFFAIAWLQSFVLRCRFPSTRPMARPSQWSKTIDLNALLTFLLKAN